MRVYVAGPMRGLADWNFPAFDAAEKRWTDAGHKVTTPASIARTTGARFGDQADPMVERLAIQVDLVYVSYSDAVALLPGWERSKGATVELALAQFLGLLVYDAVTMGPASPELTPWAGINELHEIIRSKTDARS
jgi:hypothetical protein